MKSICFFFVIFLALLQFVWSEPKHCREQYVCSPEAYESLRSLKRRDYREPRAWGRPKPPPPPPPPKPAASYGKPKPKPKPKPPVDDCPEDIPNMVVNV